MILNQYIAKTSVSHRLVICIGLCLVFLFQGHAQVKEEITGFNIGLLVNDSNELEATFTAKSVVDQINLNGGIQGSPVNLTIRSVEGSWGTGANEVVKMVFEDEVDIILGSIDGRNSHLAEQVIAKTQVLYVSAWASDPSLTQAYVPWYFSVVPTDEQQASLLVDRIAENQNSESCLVIYDATYDASQALNSFRSLAESKKELIYEEIRIASAKDLTGLKNKIQGVEYASYLLLGKELPLREIAGLLQNQNSFRPTFLNLQAMSSMQFNSIKELQDGALINGFTKLSYSEEFIALRTEFRATYGNELGLVAAHVYDGLKIIKAALNRAGTDAEKLKHVMAKTKYQGVTGEIQFDSNGKLKSVVLP